MYQFQEKYHWRRQVLDRPGVSHSNSSSNSDMEAEKSSPSSVSAQQLKTSASPATTQHLPWQTVAKTDDDYAALIGTETSSRDGSQQSSAAAGGASGGMVMTTSAGISAPYTLMEATTDSDSSAEM